VQAETALQYSNISCQFGYLNYTYLVCLRFEVSILDFPQPEDKVREEEF
jgi:hypothetical protein